MFWAQIIVYAAGIYLALGALFAVWFVVSGAGKCDEAARGAGLGFRFIIFWGAVALWPVWLRVSGFRLPVKEISSKPETGNRKPATVVSISRHRLIWLALAVVLPLVLAASVALRHAAPVNERIPQNPPRARPAN